MKSCEPLDLQLMIQIREKEHHLLKIKEYQSIWLNIFIRLQKENNESIFLLIAQSFTNPNFQNLWIKNLSFQNLMVLSFLSILM